MSCIFCKIIKGEIKTPFVYEDDSVVAFNDIKPQAPIHIIIMPRQHVDTVQNLNGSKIDIAGRLISAASIIAKRKKIDISGYRLVINCNKDAGQEIFHLHIHLLGGRKFAWPPG